MPQRTRNNDQEDQTGYYHEDHWPSGASYDYAALVGRHLEEMTDVVTPDYKRIIAQGGIVNNPCDYALVTRSCQGSGSGAHQSLSATQGWTSNGYPTAFFFPSNADVLWPQIAWQEPPVKTIDRVKLEALSRIDQTPYSFGEDTAELRETIQFLRHPVDSLLGLARSHQIALRKIRRKNGRRVTDKRFDGRLATAYRMRDAWDRYKGDARRIAKAYADVWASYSFAAAPLVRSADAAVEAWVTLPDRIHVLGRLSARSRDTQVWKGEWPDLVHYAGSGTYRHYFVSRQFVKSIHASCLYAVKNPVHDMRTELGLGSKAFPVTMWQIVPLSFMVDRLYDVSSFLKAAINLGDPRVEILAASISVKEERTGTARLTSVVNASWPGNTTGETVTDRHVSYKRDPWTPTFSDTIPKFDKTGLVRDATKIADTLAVVIKKLL